MPKVTVDKNKCIGCGVCESLCPEVFQLKNGKSSVINPEGKCNLQEAIDSCPVQAITAK